MSEERNLPEKTKEKLNKKAAIARQQEEYEKLMMSEKEAAQKIRNLTTDYQERKESGEAGLNKINKQLLACGMPAQGDEYLVRGAVLECSCGSHKRYMNLRKCHGVYIKELPVVHELDCIQGDGENITWFGICSGDIDTEYIDIEPIDGRGGCGRKCVPHIVGQWMDVHEGTRIVDNGDKTDEREKMEKEGIEPKGCATLTMDSFLVCLHGGIISPYCSGQQMNGGKAYPEDFVEGQAAYERVCGISCKETEECSHEGLLIEVGEDGTGGHGDNYCKVRYLDDDGTILKEEYISKGERPTAPEAPEDGEKIFFGWTVGSQAIYENTDIRAICKTAEEYAVERIEGWRNGEGITIEEIQACIEMLEEKGVTEKELFGKYITVEERLWVDLREYGYNETAAAAILGNACHESDGFDLSAKQSDGATSGRGLFQWSETRRSELEDLAKSMGQPWDTYKVQYAMFMKEIKNSYYEMAAPEAMNEISEKKGLDEAVKQFCKEYEKAGKGMTEDREKDAEDSYERLVQYG